MTNIEKEILLEEKNELKELEKIETAITDKSSDNKKYYFLAGAILASSMLISGAWVYTARLKISGQKTTTGAVSGENTAGVSQEQLAALEKEILPTEGVSLPIKWGDLGAQMVKNGVIDQKKFEEIYAQRGGLSDEEKNLLIGTDVGQIKITPENSAILLNLFWALGLGNKNEILEKGPMSDPKYGGAANFASTGGWTLARGDVMQHFSKHSMIKLTPEQQQLVDKVSKGIYRPCCGNSVYFPDCNHGMAMLGLLELMASQGVKEDEMNRVALQVNSYWFPDTYLTIAKYLQSKGVAWKDANPAELLGYNFSSGAGYKQILSQTEPAKPQGGGGCGV